MAEKYVKLEELQIETLKTLITQSVIQNKDFKFYVDDLKEIFYQLETGQPIDEIHKLIDRIQALEIKLALKERGK